MRRMTEGDFLSSSCMWEIRLVFAMSASCVVQHHQAQGAMSESICLLHEHIQGVLTDDFYAFTKTINTT